MGMRVRVRGGFDRRCEVVGFGSFLFVHVQAVGIHSSS